jgi:hypothetical protein
VGDALDLLIAQIPLIVTHTKNPFSHQPHSGKARLHVMLCMHCECVWHCASVS